MASKIFVAILLLAALAPQLNAQESSNVVEYKLAFGSCFKHQYLGENPVILNHVIADKPDSFVWLGDFAYLDVIKTFPKERFEYQDLKTIKKLFDISYNDPIYQKLKKSTPIYGIWDDHDSGINNSDTTNIIKEEVRQLFLDAMDEPRDSIRRTRKDGMYQSYYMDKGKLIKMIMLDIRYNKDDPKDKSIPESQKTDLGREQEEWMVREIENSTAVFTLITFGVKLMTDDRAIIELPYDRTRELILTTANQKTNILIISGDIHMAEVTVDSCSKHIHGYPITEVTSSGLTHSILGQYGDLTYPIMDFIYPETYNKPEDRYYDMNYGLLEFAIDTKSPEKSQVVVHIKNVNGDTKLYRQLGPKYWTRAAANKSEYAKCLQARGPKEQRKKANMWKKALDLKHPIFYVIASVVLGALLVLRIIVALICARFCKPKKNSDKEKDE